MLVLHPFLTSSAMFFSPSISVFSRYCQPPADFWDWFSPYLDDEEVCAVITLPAHSNSSEDIMAVTKCFFIFFWCVVRVIVVFRKLI